MAKYGFAHGQNYTADDWALYFAGFVGDGVLPGPAANQLMIVERSGMTTGVRPGYGYIKGRYLYADGNETLTLAQADGTLHRIDRVVLRLDTSNDDMVMSLALLTGTPKTIPEPPVLTRNGTVHELCLAEIAVAAGTTSVTQDMITDTRGDMELCGWASMLPRELDTTGLWAQFNAWFAQLRSTLDENQASNLYAMATVAQDAAGAAREYAKERADTIKQRSNAVSDATQVFTFTESGEWIAPAAGRVDVWLVGGGMGGGTRSSTNRNVFLFGSGGKCKLIKNIDVVPGETYNVIVGAGGGGQVYSSSNTHNGGASSFGEHTSEGGSFARGVWDSDDWLTDSVEGTLFVSQGGVNSSPPGVCICYSSAGSIIKATTLTAFSGFRPDDVNGSTNPYNGIIYGRAAPIKPFKIYNGSKRDGLAGAPNTGDGGDGAFHNRDDAGAPGAGGSGIVIIYFTPEEV